MGKTLDQGVESALGPLGRVLGLEPQLGFGRRLAFGLADGELGLMARRGHLPLRVGELAGELGVHLLAGVLEGRSPQRVGPLFESGGGLPAQLIGREPELLLARGP